MRSPSSCTNEYLHRKSKQDHVRVSPKGLSKSPLAVHGALQRVRAPVDASERHLRFSSPRRSAKQHCADALPQQGASEPNLSHGDYRNQLSLEHSPGSSSSSGSANNRLVHVVLARSREHSWHIGDSCLSAGMFVPPVLD